MSATFGANENTNPTPITMEGQHSVLAEPHLPAAGVPTQAAPAPAPSQSSQTDVDVQREVLDKFPPANKGHDDKLKASAGQFAADLKTTAKEVGANIKAGIQTAPAQIKDTWQKLTAKASQLKEEHFNSKGKVQQSTGGEVKQQEQI